MALASFKFLCPDSEPANPFAFNDACIRASWSALLPLACSVLFCLASITPKRARLFTAFLTLDEAASLSGSPPIQPDVAPRPSKGTTIALASPALLQVLLWAGVGIFQMTSGTFGSNKIPFLLALSWVYPFLRPLVKRIVVAPLDLFWLYLLQLGGAGLLLGGAVFYPTESSHAHAITIDMVVLVANAALTCIPLVIVLRLPLALPVIEPVPGGLVSLC
jgi:hypothetical protein